MIVYLVTGLLACIFAIASGNAHEDERSQNLLWALAFLVLFIPSALRYGIGTDYTNIQGYVEVFDIYANGGTAPDGMDVGFVALIKLIALFTRNPQWLFVVSSAIICGFELRACRRLSCNAGLSVALLLAGGLYLESFNIMRQWIDHTRALRHASDRDLDVLETVCGAHVADGRLLGIRVGREDRARRPWPAIGRDL